MAVGPTWTYEDQALHVANEKWRLATLLRHSKFFNERSEELLTCIDALRHALLTWAEGK